MFKSKRMGLHLRVTLVISFILLVIFLIVNTFNVFSLRRISRDSSIQIIEEMLSEKTRTISDLLSSSFDNLNIITSAVQTLLDDGVRDRNYYEEFIKSIMKDFPDYIGSVSLMFEPNVFGLDSDYINTKYRDSSGRFAVYFQRSPDNSINSSIFTEEELLNDYYTEPLKTGNKYLTDIYSFNFSGEDLSMYTWSIPVYIGNRIVGVVTIDVFTDFLQRALSAGQIKTFENVEYSLFTDTGVIGAISQNMSGLGNNIKDVYPSYRNNVSIGRISQGESFSYMAKSEITDLGAIHTVGAVPVSENKYWGVEIIVPESAMLVDANRLSIIMIVAAIASLVVLSICISTVVKRIITSKIFLLVKDIERLSTGDISWCPPEQMLSVQNELGDIARAVAKILDQFNETIGSVKTTSDEMEMAANEMAQGNADLSMRTESQAAVLEETASSMEEMASTIKSSADHSMLGDKMMIESRASVKEAGDVISSTTSSIEDVLEASTRIKDITKTIEAIALQTNILALNAAVEAARAGEQGRGFAVVASEVRSLAQTTQVSVKDITELVANVDEKIKLATSSARKSQDIFLDIQSKIEDTAKIMQEISSTAVEQQTGVSEINRAVSEMDITTQKNAALVEESTASSEALLSQARELVSVVSFFKTREDIIKSPITSDDGESVEKDSAFNKKSHSTSSNETSETKTKTKPYISSNYESSHPKAVTSRPVNANSTSNSKDEFGSSSITSSNDPDEDFETF